ACLSTFAMRWLIPRLHDFTAKYPRYDVRLATDDRPPRTAVDVQIVVLPPDTAMPDNSALLFEEHLGLIVAPSAAKAPSDDLLAAAAEPARLETRTRPHIWREWSRLTGEDAQDAAPATRIFDHYHLTIEAALSGLGVAIAPWHLVAAEIASGRLIAPHEFLPSGYRYVVKLERPGRRKTEHFVGWLKEAIADFPQRPA
ncbi:MAG: LysR family transcriptional regulator, partial [Alphaproteobacteria bacterium]|nr:LysR family transcriptional regulator [Alphaproteobacteria bacterium]